MIDRDAVILFDLDGTLIDSTDAILDSFRVAYESFDLEVPKDEDIVAEIGYPLDDMFISLGIERDRVDEFVAAFKQNYRKISRDKTTLLPFAKEAVEEAFKIARVGVVTTKTTKFSTQLMSYLGLMSYFEVFIGREDVKYPKPHPEPILKALERFDIDKSRCWMVGDTCLDIDSAKSAGINSIALLSGYGTEEQLAKCSATIKKNSLEAVTYIKKNLISSVL
ncbi:Phosphoglycolate phosphatase [hydrothermal vent metagenome]|uniref:Phosphoglycolate phosphatase n=1 Tax=hydrothermal vent metagenome TaxID=652676 RepID=A0A1W1CF76_9ZZZZ